MSGNSKAEPLCREWKLNVKQALYSDWGNFYGLIKKYPAALLDANGYYLVTSAAALSAPGISVGKRINVPKLISALPGYVRMKRDETVPAEEIVEGETYVEGAVSKITVNRYERDKSARSACLKHWGYSCGACSVNLAKIYGDVAKEFIHVHHVVEISSVGTRYEIDPKRDLRPVCPNCHAIIHRRSPPYTVEEVADMIKKQRG